MNHKKNNNKKVIHQAIELEKLIRSWNLISWATKGEFESLSHQLISQLYRDSDFDKIFNVIFSELNSYYGLDVIEKEAIDFTEEVINWWSNQN